MYKATARILRQTTTFDRALFNTQLFDLRDAQRDLQTGSGLIKLDKVAEMVKTDLKSLRDPRSLLRKVSVEPQLNTDIINISATGADAREAAGIANSFARQFISYRQTADRAALSNARSQVEQQLAGMTVLEQASERGAILAQRAGDLHTLEAMQTGGYEVVQLAEVPETPASPRPVRNVFAALIGGLLVGILLAFVVDRLDRRIKTTDSLEKEFGLPLLAGIPRLNHLLIPDGSARSDASVSFSDPSPRFVESFRSLRSNLKYFEFDRQIRTIAVTSGLPREGKTVTTVNLAVSLALSGARVAVIEADLRRPMVHRYFRLSNAVGVSNILAGTHNLPTVMQRVKIDQHAPLNRQVGGDPSQPQRLERNLFCLTSGPLPPNPAELIGSQQMKTLIEDAAALADYVLIDTPPVLVVADALSLMGLVDAVIVCSRINSTTIEEARQVRTLLHRIGAHTLGVVAGGVKASKRRDYDNYGYFVSEPQIDQPAAGGGSKPNQKRAPAPAPMGRSGR
jgi:Mrp family chromosome partitioning ATPase/capsular polysaccharide biosynthesis protein